MKPLSVMSRTIATWPAPSFNWGEGEDADDAIGEVNDEYVEQFDRVNSMAAQAYVLATVEWIYWYVRDHLTPEDARDYEEYIEGHWVWICTLPRQVPPPPYDPEGDETTLRQVCNDAILTGLDRISGGIYSLKYHETAVDAAYLTQLCEYIFPEKHAFHEWRVKVLDRLQRYFPDDAVSFKKTTVCRSIFDTDLPAASIDQAAACKDFVSGALSAGDNHYLPLEKPD
ncbi:hypothetical protein [Caballeronia ptereochthonis]|uniref:Uncharacterized protein n=1 Tax=Caballeronia ptereochthonis TaxID=1777144 RepID=A0A157ZYY9_9BURK|nr:hypothetical protein [Caballeronia ptereochthonis]SAK50751.1 hypothetical protein AWB83_01172 [Caballeronia ptereochthonis]